MINLDSFFNLEEAVVTWAEREFDLTSTKFQRKLKEKQKKKGVEIIKLTIDWSKIIFSHVTNWKNLEDDCFQPAMQPELNLKIPSNSLKNSVSVLFQTCFKNTTDEVQEYTMKTEKTTKSSVSTEVEKGITKGTDLSVKLSLPNEIFESNVGFNKEISLNNVAGESFEEELQWGVEALIKVKPGHIADCSLLIIEKKQNGEFEVVTSLKGNLFVTFTNLKDNNSLIKTMSHDIGSIIRDHLEREKRKGNDMSDFIIVHRDGRVEAKTKGTCHFRYGIKQEVVINQTAIM